VLNSPKKLEERTQSIISEAGKRWGRDTADTTQGAVSLTKKNFLYAMVGFVNRLWVFIMRNNPK
jgi:hypothetical protein